MILPNFIIIGTQKAATTFIHRALREHPEVFMPKDEVTFSKTPIIRIMILGYLRSYSKIVIKKKC
jgi:hypothetical protein